MILVALKLNYPIRCIEAQIIEVSVISRTKA
jgi:hypothetical protein